MSRWSLRRNSVMGAPTVTVLKASKETKHLGLFSLGSDFPSDSFLGQIRYTMTWVIKDLSTKCLRKGTCHSSPVLGSGRTGLLLLRETGWGVTLLLFPPNDFLPQAFPLTQLLSLPSPLPVHRLQLTSPLVVCRGKCLTRPTLHSGSWFFPLV